MPTARKSIADIEAKDGAISNLHGTFSTIHLSVFSETDQTVYWNHFHETFPTDQNYQFIVSYLSGGHPWLMDVINSRVFLLGNEKSNIEAIIAKMGLDLMETLDTILHTLGEERLLNDAIQIVIGPYFNVDKKTWNDF